MNQIKKLKLPDLSMDDFMVAVKKCKPTVSPGDLDKYNEFTKQFGE